jgi:hypothetical protein
VESVPARPVSLFSYGTLQDKKVQRANFGRELEGRPDALPGYTQRLVTIADPLVLAISGKRQHPIVQPSLNPQDEVWGVVLELTEPELALADAYEVSEYKRVSVTLKSGVQAWVYIRA